MGLTRTSYRHSGTELHIRVEYMSKEQMVGSSRDKDYISGDPFQHRRFVHLFSSIVALKSLKVQCLCQLGK